jgi:hypothetical protein
MPWWRRLRAASVHATFLTQMDSQLLPIRLCDTSKLPPEVIAFLVRGNTGHVTCSKCLTLIRST